MDRHPGPDRPPSRRRGQSSRLTGPRGRASPCPGRPLLAPRPPHWPPPPAPPPYHDPARGPGPGPAPGRVSLQRSWLSAPGTPLWSPQRTPLSFGKGPSAARRLNRRPWPPACPRGAGRCRRGRALVPAPIRASPGKPRARLPACALGPALLPLQSQAPPPAAPRLCSSRCPAPLCRKNTPREAPRIRGMGKRIPTGGWATLPLGAPTSAHPFRR